MKTTRKGFTLIELMIVVAIIGILAAIAIPKFADLINKSKEGATKAGLSSLRSALQVYYGDNEGRFPAYAATAQPYPKQVGFSSIPWRAVIVVDRTLPVPAFQKKTTASCNETVAIC